MIFLPPGAVLHSVKVLLAMSRIFELLRLRITGTGLGIYLSLIGNDDLGRHQLTYRKLNLT